MCQGIFQVLLIFLDEIQRVFELALVREINNNPITPLKAPPLFWHSLHVACPKSAACLVCVNYHHRTLSIFMPTRAIKIARESSETQECCQFL